MSLTSTQFLNYGKALQQELDDTDKVTSWLRYVAMEIRRSWSKDPSTVRYEDINLSFERVEKAAKKTKKRYEMDDETRLKLMKAYWRGVAGFEKED